jgi:hypothetical protein
MPLAEKDGFLPFAAWLRTEFENFAVRSGRTQISRPIEVASAVSGQVAVGISIIGSESVNHGPGPRTIRPFTQSKDEAARDLTTVTVGGDNVQISLLIENQGAADGQAWRECATWKRKKNGLCPFAIGARGKLKHNAAVCRSAEWARVKFPDPGDTHYPSIYGYAYETGLAFGKRRLS